MTSVIDWRAITMSLGDSSFRSDALGAPKWMPVAIGMPVFFSSTGCPFSINGTGNSIILVAAATTAFVAF